MLLTMRTSADSADGRVEPDGELVRLRDGTEILVRAVRPGDKALIAEGFAGLDPRSRRSRFLLPLDELTAETLAYLTEIDHVDHEALGALGPGGEPLGVARYVRRSDEPRVAEVAVAVVDAWQRRGIATALLSRLARRAVDSGIERFSATVLPDNDEMLALLERVGSVRRLEGQSELVEADVKLADALRTADAVRELVRHVGRGLHRSGTSADPTDGKSVG